MALAAEHANVPSDKTRTIQVIGAGLSRTGTVSFAQALERLLGGQVCHSGSAAMLREEAFIKSWISILDPKPGMDDRSMDVALRDLLAGYTAIVDTPSVYVVAELARAFPDAKIICTVRDPEKWFESYQELIKIFTPWYLDILFFPVPTLRFFKNYVAAITKRHLTNYGTNVPSSDMMRQHTEYVKRSVPEDRLFFFSVKDGWEPLCKILNCPVPDEPFPFANDREALKEATARLEMKAGRVWMGIFAASGIAIAAAYAYFR